LVVNSSKPNLIGCKTKNITSLFVYCDVVMCNVIATSVHSIDKGKVSVLKLKLTNLKFISLGS